jgi:hypothetical protein
MKKILFFVLLLLSVKIQARIRYDNGGISLSNSQLGEYTIQGGSWEIMVTEFPLMA